MENTRNNPIVPLSICLDFDGTVVTHAYPEIGVDIGAVPYLKALSNAGVQIILWTMRGQAEDGTPTEPLRHAMAWFDRHGIKLAAINTNLDPSVALLGVSGKILADAYLDDRNVGVDLQFDPNISPRPFVDWKRVGPLLLAWANAKIPATYADKVDTIHTGEAAT